MGLNLTIIKIRFRMSLFQKIFEHEEIDPMDLVDPLYIKGAKRTKNIQRKRAARIRRENEIKIFLKVSKNP